MDSLPGIARSLWLDTKEPAARPPLEGSRSTEVAVIGGGIVGATAALLLAERGVEVTLLEANRVATGVTGHSTAKATALHETSYSRISRKVGAEAAAAYAELNVEGLGLIATLVERHGIECSLETAPSFLYTEDESCLATLEDECRAAAQAGLEVELVDDTELPFDVRGAIRLGGQIALDSAALTRGIVGAAEGAGAAIHEDSRVRSVGHRDPGRIGMENGASLQAERIVLATHMPLLDRGLFFARLRPQASYVVSGPAPDAPIGMYLGIGSATRSVRSTPGPDGTRSLLVGGAGHKVGQGDGSHAYEELASWARERFAVEADHRWSAHDMMSPDELPMIGPVAPWTSRIQTATGFGKWGIAKGVAAAAMLCGEILDGPDPRREVFDTNRLSLRAQLPDLVKENADVGFRFFAGRLRRGTSAALAAGEGHVVGEGRRQVAECRDANGELHRLSARCTHLGCIVNWNSGDATWDCPCHGSRFTADGSVRNGPAAAPLEPIE